MDANQIEQANQKLISDWIDDLENLNDRTDGTAKNYKSVINNLMLTSGKLLTEIEYSDIKTLLKSIKDYAYDTKARYQVTIIVFYKWLLKNKLIKEHPFPSMEIGKKPKRLSKRLDEDKYIKAKQYVQDNFNRKERLIVSIIKSIGLRIHEVVKVSVEDINFKNKYISIIGKEDKERVIGLKDELLDEIKEYMNEIGITTGYLFPSKMKGHRDEHITSKSIQDKFKKASEELGFKFHPHLLRHQFALDYMDNGGNLTCLKETLGHNNLSTTQIYTLERRERIIADNQKCMRVEVF